MATKLRDQALAVSNLASLPHISVGGAIATATHGSGTAGGNLATAVAGLEIVTGSGERVYGDLPWDQLLDNFDDVFAGGYSVSVFTRFGDVAGQLWIKQRRDLDTAAPSVSGAPAAPIQRHLIDGLDPDNCTHQLGTAGPSLERLPTSPTCGRCRRKSDLGRGWAPVCGTGGTG